MIPYSIACVVHVFLSACAAVYSFPRPDGQGQEFIKHTALMTGCEKSLYTTCVLKLATAENLINKCDASLLISCLNKHLSADICRRQDKETLPTIEMLLREVSRRFKEKKTCGNARFIRKVKEHFLVQSKSIEANIDDFDQSGSGDSMDDSEFGDDDTDAIVKDSAIKPKVASSDPKGVEDVVQTWKERGRHMLGNKEWTRMAVFFDAPKDPSAGQKLKPAVRQEPQSKKKTKYDSELKKLDKDWKRLKSEYELWFTRSKRNGESGT